MQGCADTLADELAALGMGTSSGRHEPLRGVPVPTGTHVRFDDSGKAVASPGNKKTLLRGVPQPTGRVTKFE